MSYAVEPQIFDKFRGIREFNGINSGGAISALECENVELIASRTSPSTAAVTRITPARVFHIRSWASVTRKPVSPLTPVPLHSRGTLRLIRESIT